MRHLLLSVFLFGVPVFGASGIKAVFIKDGNVFSANTDGTGLRQLTGDGTPKSLPLWSRDSSEVVYIEQPADDALARLVWIDSTTGRVKSKITMRQRTGAEPRGMRFVQHMEWVSEDTLLVGGSINPSTVECALIDKKTGQEITGALCDGFSLAKSPDGKHIACVGFVPHGTATEDRKDYLELDGRRVFPEDDERVQLIGNPTWNDDGSRLAVLVQYGTGKQEAVVLMDGTLYRKSISDDVQVGVTSQLFWVRDALYLESTAGLRSLDDNSSGTDNYEIQKRRPSHAAKVAHGLRSSIARMNGSQPDFFVLP